MHYYIETLTSDVYRGNYTSYQFKDYVETHEISFTPSSCALLAFKPSTDLVIPEKTKYILNVRLVNYSIDEMGCYHMRHPNGKVVTRNSFVLLDENYNCLLYTSPSPRD